MYKAKGYLSRFFDQVLRQFHSNNGRNQCLVDTDQTSCESIHEYPLVISYFCKDSRRFVNKFSKIIWNQLDVKIFAIYKSFKVKSCFNESPESLGSVLECCLSFHVFVRPKQDIHVLLTSEY